MKITVEFTNLGETVEFSDFIKGITAAPQPTRMAAAEAVQNAVPSTTMPPAADNAVSSAPAQQAPAPAFPQNQAPAAPQQAAPPQPAPVPAGGVPTAAAPVYTAEDLAKAAQPLLDAGRHADLQALLQSFGVAALPMLPQEMFGAFATALRGMGAQI